MPKKVFLICIGLIAFLIALIPRIPLSVIEPSVVKALRSANGGRPMSALALYGTLWKGQISGIRLGTLPALDVTLKASPWSLAGLRYDASVTIEANGVGGSGQTQLSLSGLSLIDTQLLLDAEALHLPANFKARGSVTVDLKKLDVTRQGLCKSATGTASSSLLRSLPSAFGGWSGPDLEGPIKCKDGYLTTNLSGRTNDGDEVILAISTNQSKRLVYRLEVRSTDLILGTTLRASGFNSDQANIYVFTG